MITNKKTETVNQPIADNESYFNPLLQNNSFPGGDEDDDTEDDEDQGDLGELEDIDPEGEDVASAIDEEDDPVLDDADLEENDIEVEEVEDIDWEEDEEDEEEEGV